MYKIVSRACILSGLLLMISCGGGTNSTSISPDSTDSTVAESSTTVAEDSAPAVSFSDQEWTLLDTVITQEENLQSNVWSPEKTVKVGDTYRSYFVSKKDGYLIFAESLDGFTYTKRTRTNLQRSSDPTSDTSLMDHPVVLQRVDGKFLLVYDICTGDCNVPPSLPRRLVARVSDDGINWGPSALIPGPGPAGLNPGGTIFDSVPTLLQLDSGDIRVYYVQGGGAIGSAITSDGGASWTVEDGLRLGENDGGLEKEWHIDPAVFRDSDGTIHLYFGLVTDWNCLPNGGSEKGCIPIRMASSTDGLTFTKLSGDVLSPGPGATQFGDPDVFIGPDGKVLMLMGYVEMVNQKMTVKLRLAERTK